MIVGPKIIKIWFIIKEINSNPCFAVMVGLEMNLGGQINFKVLHIIGNGNYEQ